MKFNIVLGNVDDKIVAQAQSKLTAAITELATNTTTKVFGSKIGGDGLIYQLIFPAEHICDGRAVQLEELEKQYEDEKFSSLSKEEQDKIIHDLGTLNKLRVIRTAATDGKRFWWNPSFINSLSDVGVRLVLMHEAWHVILMHPARRGSRLPTLYNIAIDFKVDNVIFEDLKSRGFHKNVDMFKEHLGDFISLNEYAQFLKDPFNPPEKLKHMSPTESLKRKLSENTNQEFPTFYFAEPSLEKHIKRPEAIYDYLVQQIPRCPDCNRLGFYKKPEEYKKLLKEQEEKHKKCQHEQDISAQKENEKQLEEENKSLGIQIDFVDEDKKDKNNSKEDNETIKKNSKYDFCPTCSDGMGHGNDDYMGIFDVGDLLDEHFDIDMTEEELNKKIHEAIEINKKLGGTIPGGMEDELGIIGKPVLTWEDFVRGHILNKRKGSGKKDWSLPRIKPLSMGLYVPQRKDYFLKILAVCDSSGSMSPDDMGFGLGQLQIIDDKGEVSVTWFDTVTYWNHTVQLDKVDFDTLKTKIKPVGRGGTMVSSVFNEYEKNIGQVDLIIIMTDGYLYDMELTEAKRPPRDTSVMWLITSHNKNFKPPFGRVFHLRNEKL